MIPHGRSEMNWIIKKHDMYKNKGEGKEQWKWKTVGAMDGQRR